ncbi:MAG: metalloprotease TldD [Gammaproteobacteria bacterium TMED243]|jgi:TldD protein|nr:metalloprotease TldD [Gammaproteobacteria bacterium]RPG33956.1 MAG: metalloprotease TldD [Gammaproteobacteria bacterium TMED243]|tara:strand:+ start:2336 stop:3781 length:1446 start_codon:yes stop_codon:yes gene_type:complete
MNEVVATVEKQLLQAKGMSLSDIEHSIGTLLGREIDYGEVFIQSTRGESFGLEDGIVKDGSFGVEAGIGVRALAGEKTGFAYSEDIRLDGLQEAAKAAQSIAGAGAPRNLPSFRVGGYPSLYAAIDPISSLSDEEKVSLLQRVDQVARAQDPRVQEVNVRISGNHETMLVMASDGTLAADIRPLVRFDVSVIVEHNGRRERGNAGGGGRRSLDSLAEGEWTDNLAKEAVRMALVNLEAVDAPAGPMPVVLGPGWPGVLLHEAVGHGLEGDFNRKGSSAFSNRVGEQVASPLCTVVDDGTLEARRGSLSVDDEGTQTQMTTLIENGVLKGYMQDKLNARLMNVAATGNGRRQSYAHVPMPRMTNTYMLPGQDMPEDIIRSVKNGIYAVNFGGGSVDITSGRFVFSATEAYRIEDGQVTAPIRGATLVGSGPEVMNRISMVGNDLDLDGGVGVCGKDGQSVPVGVGQPTLKVDEIVVGGTATS